MSDLTEIQILNDAIEKHKLGVLLIHDQEYSLLCLIRYARNIGYNEGYMDRANKQ
jgi:hypothetical protein